MLGFVRERAIATSTGPLTPDPSWDADIDAYARHNPADGALLNAGRARHPVFHEGGWVLRLQPRAGAMTLDTDVFVRAGSWQESIYVHELVHVHQYAGGQLAFLTSYFGRAAGTLLTRLVTRKPLDPMTAAPQEAEAYGVEHRFVAWQDQGRGSGDGG
ncbi:hypothetical protein [Fodinicola acaciae]|uniref:hypothetical protein n=1 Tax=Fodinicola acaciae TaxID=2681555 RepID=UPI0013D3DE91|nr:hypothetical protein [Fodinicola acaciae]